MKVICPCGAEYSVDSALIGRRLRCSCGRILTVGSPGGYEATSQKHTEQSAPQTSKDWADGEVPASTGSGRIGLLTAAAMVVLFIGLALSGSEQGSTTATSVSGRGSGTSLPAGLSALTPPASRPHPSQNTDQHCTLFQQKRPTSGHELISFESKGYGRLSIENGTSSDAVAMLVRKLDGVPYRAIYIRAHQTGLFTRVAEGRYALRFELGQHWLSSRTFCQVLGISEFLQTLDFDEQYESDGILYSKYQVTLQPVLGGTARTEHIAPSEFRLPSP
jgi:hypothetical protein